MSSTRTSILTQVQLTDIIQISHVEARLQKNFELIIEELMRQGEGADKKDGDIRELREMIAVMQEKLQEIEKSQETKTEQMKGDILGEVKERDQAVKKEIMDMIEAERQKAELEAQRRAEEGLNFTNNTVEEMMRQINALKARMQLNKKIGESRDQTMESLRNQMKNMSESLNKQIDALKEDLIRQNEIFQEELNRQNQINHDQFERMQNQQIHVGTYSSVPSQASLRRAYDSQKDFHNQTNTTLPSSAPAQDLNLRIAALEQRLSQLSDHMRDKDKVIQTHTKQIWDLNEKAYNMEKSNDVEHAKIRQQINNVRVIYEEGGKVSVEGSPPVIGRSDDEKRLKELEKKMDLLLQSNDMMSRNLKECEDQIETIVTHINTSSRNNTSAINDKQTQSKEFVKSDSNNSELKRELLLKINDQRKQYMTILKSMINGNKKTQANDEMNRAFEDALNEIKFQVNKKADEQTTRKAVVFLERKINYIFNTFLNLSEEDARIGKKSWFCLSCDRRLNNFTGKVGEHIPQNAMRGNKLSSSINLERHIINPEAPIQRYKSKSKLDLPVIQTTNSKRI